MKLFGCALIRPSTSSMCKIEHEFDINLHKSVSSILAKHSCLGLILLFFNLCGKIGFYFICRDDVTKPNIMNISVVYFETYKNMKMT